MSFTPRGTRTLIVYGPASEGWPTMTARRTGGGNAGKGFHARSSDRADLKTSCPGLPNPPLRLPGMRTVITITADSTVLVIRPSHLTRCPLFRDPHLLRRI